MNAPAPSTSPAVDALVRHYDQSRDKLPGRGLPWLSSMRDQGMARFQDAGFPDRTIEDWKYTSLRQLEKLGFLSAVDAPLIEDLPPLHALSSNARRLVFVNGRLVTALSKLEGLETGCRVSGLATALVEDPEGVEPLLTIEEGGKAGPLTGLNSALAADGLVLRLKPGTQVSQPIEVFHISSGDSEPTAYHPRHIIQLAPNSQATLVEHHIGSAKAPCFINAFTTIGLAEGAKLRHIKLFDGPADAIQVDMNGITLAREARYEGFGLTLGGLLTRCEAHVSLAGEGAHCQLSGAYAQSGEQHCDNTTIIEHRVANTSCREVFKGVLDGKSRGIFQGRIVVHKDAQKTDGHQLSKTLLISDQAEINTKPELEIYADDVKCSHGATAGQLDEQALFYLRSRGLPVPAAQALLVRAFLAEAVEEVSDEELRAALLARIDHWLSGERG